MSEINEMEVMELENENYDAEIEEADEKSGGLGVAALIVGGVLAAGGLTIAAVKTLKAKKADKPKKPKTKLKLVRVPIEEEVYEEELPAEDDVIEAE